MDKKFIEDDFELDAFQRNFIIKREFISKKKKTLERDKFILKAAGFVIMIVMLVLGSFLYTFLFNIIEKYFI